MPLYSYSRIGCFENCPRQYKFRYIEKPDIVKPEGVEAFMGKMVHETLEQCYRLVQAGRVLSVEEMLAFYQRRWQESLPENLRIVKPDMTAQDYFNMGARAIERYHARHAPFDREITLGLERRVVFSLDPDGKYKIQGYIDRLTRDQNGKLRIQDYKTSGNLPSQQEADADSQLALYQIAVEEMWPDNNGIELVWHYLQFDTMLVSYRDKNQLEELRQRYIDKIRKIERAEELQNFPTQESSLCDWCEYYQLCPAKGGKGAVTTDESPATIKRWSKSEIAAFVDEYVVCDFEKKKLESRQQEIREILKQLGEIGSDNLFEGSGAGDIVLTLTRVAKLPTKSADIEAIEEIADLVERAGLKDRFSSLDIPALQKAYTEGTLPPELMEKLKPYEIIAVQDRLRIKKK